MSNDPFAVADNAKPREFEYFGQVTADAWFAYFAGNGAKPVVFDPNQHPEDKQSTIIDLQVIPLPEQNITFELSRSIVHWSQAWTKLTLPSIKAVGLSGLRDLHNKFVRCTFASTGRTYKKSDGTEGDETSFKFLEVYADEDACRAAYSGAYKKDDAPPTEQQQPQGGNGNGNGNGNGSDPNQEAALKFARVVVQNAIKQNPGDLVKVQGAVTTSLAGMPMINAHYSGNSPEITQMIIEEMGK